jgi:hypothetical protein
MAGVSTDRREAVRARYAAAARSARADVLISARRVGPTGRAIGIDMT